MLVTDGFGRAFTNLLVEPAAGVFAARLSCHGRPVRAELMLQIFALIEIGKGADAELVETRLCDLADAGHLAHRQPGKNAGLVPRMDKQNTVRLRQIRGDFRHHA